VGVVASVALLAMSAFVEVAYLRFVNAVSDAQITLAMSIHAIVATVAVSLHECPAELGFV
jgi:hypothetical protein